MINGTGLDPERLDLDRRRHLRGPRHPQRGGRRRSTSKSLVVLTDGVENQPRLIADVAADINEFTYAVGLGQPQNISVPALQTISGNNGGYLLVTGPIGTDNRFMLQKYFLQILAGISNAEIVLDPDGDLIPGQVERVPFQLTAGDAGVDVILLTPDPQVVDFRVETPSGQIIEPWRAQSEPGMRFVLSDGRQLLPARAAVRVHGRPVRRGRHLERAAHRSGVPGWNVATAATAPIPSIRHVAADRSPGGRGERPGPPGPGPAQSILATEQGMAESGAIGAPLAVEPGLRRRAVQLVVHAYSNLTLEAQAEQSGFEPGARREARLRALAQSGIPFDASRRRCGRR